MRTVRDVIEQWPAATTAHAPRRHRAVGGRKNSRIAREIRLHPRGVVLNCQPFMSRGAPSQAACVPKGCCTDLGSNGGALGISGF